MTQPRNVSEAQASEVHAIFPAEPSAGLIRPAISANLSLAGMRYLGPTLATTLASTSPLFGAAFGILWLGEVLN